jgi:hypothetical protein
MIVISAATRPLHSSILRMSIHNLITNQRNSTTVKMKLIWNYDVSSFSILSKSKYAMKKYLNLIFLKLFKTSTHNYLKSCIFRNKTYDKTLVREGVRD